MKKILLSHGGGGEETQKLIKDLFFKYFSNEILEKMEDSAILDINSKIAFTTDSFTVSPIFFKGGNIGKLSIAGTVNDLSVMGARPLYLSVSFIIEEGFDYDDLEKIVKSMAEESKKSGVLIVTGDTKVVPKGSIDKIFINTAGIGKVIYEGLSASNLSEGDIIIVSGTIGDHGACIMAEREGMEMELDLESDCASLWDLVEYVINNDIKIKAMRDPTRGGLSAVLNEWAFSSNVNIEIEEGKIPIKNEVQGLCELVGLESYNLANEGKIVFAVDKNDAESLLEILKKHPLGKEAEIIGKVIDGTDKKVILKTTHGTKRIMEPPSGELLPRIC
ncbi:hydrogenase expression/formation protein HypE [Venenivibrio stagnispumantis]|uniref:Hydrogenase maturation protein, carbamoyl dehydratase HypE n=1 Tax=Venenivibrio stagnispumantis TaxID=407998 RepID=A0AA45WMU3_9AQUI|nr:hydrogenase expression/formation protein HypE [Venenivibrio stagnispumantis]MCW4573086.1 hydrogenase expression/formation protein HypE [Venenivibrio stagnispumantis]SMP15260.1 Hydrogenase maturation protein, carbamoyl dehydratase HypE [Venenivibrio stagnispumantis]